MEPAKSDRRIRKTQTLFRKTLTRLLLEKDLKDISVSSLTQIADVNRGTFYLHYKDIYDLFEQIESEALADFARIITEYRRRDVMAWQDIMLDLFKYIEGNADIFMAILKTKESTFLSKVIEMNRPKSPNEWRQMFPTGTEKYYEYYYAFFTSGCTEMVRSWFIKGMPESAEQMAALAEKLMTNCVRDLP